MKFGAHMSTSGGVWKSLERGRATGCEIVQLFVKNNMQWFGKPYEPADLALYANEFVASQFACVFAHAGYLINLAAAAGEKRDNSLKSLAHEIRLAAQLGLPFLVMHPGAHLGAGEKEGIKQLVAGLNEVFRVTREYPVRIALENTAGQGSCLGAQIAHLAAVYDSVDHPHRLALCLDTAHFLESGYDLRTPSGWDAAIAEVDRLVGAGQIVAFHLNDSKTDLGSRVDRHEHIGKGKIGLEAFRHIVNDARFRDHPGCLETPKSEDMHEDLENLALLRSLVRAAPALKPRRRK